MSNKKEITEIKFSSTNVLKMIITWAIFAAFIWKCAAAPFFFFVFVHQKNNFSNHLIEQFFVTILYCNTRLITFPSQRLAYSATVFKCYVTLVIVNLVHNYHKLMNNWPL